MECDVYASCWTNQWNILITKRRRTILSKKKNQRSQSNTVNFIYEWEKEFRKSHGRRQRWRHDTHENDSIHTVSTAPLACSIIKLILKFLLRCKHGFEVYAKKHTHIVCLLPPSPSSLPLILCSRFASCCRNVCFFSSFYLCAYPTIVHTRHRCIHNNKKKKTLECTHNVHNL